MMPVLAAPAPVRVLIVTGQSDTQYHDWRVTTPFYKHVLDTTGRFDVRVLEEPRGLSRETLADYDVVVLNYNGPRWGAVAETALEEFVRSGKGLVSMHGVTYGPLMGFVLQPDGSWKTESGWPAYRQMLGVDWSATPSAMHRGTRSRSKPPRIRSPAVSHRSSPSTMSSITARRIGPE